MPRLPTEVPSALTTESSLRVRNDPDTKRSVAVLASSDITVCCDSADFKIPFRYASISLHSVRHAQKFFPAKLEEVGIRHRGTMNDDR
jgi:hypothetical protein